MRYIFILSTPRSGSTLLQSLMMNADMSYSGPETHFFSILNSRNFLKSEFYSRRERLTKLWKEYDSDYSYSTFSSFLRKGRISREFRQVIDGYMERNGVEVYIEKTPKHLHYIEDISRVFPGAQFVHLIRSPYENVRSLYRATNDYAAQWSGSRNIDTCVKRWKHDIGIHSAFLGNDHHLYVDYDDVVSRPKDVVNSIFYKLDLKCKGEFSINASSIIRPDEIWKENNMKDIGMSSEHEFPVGYASFYDKYAGLLDMYESIKAECLGK